jgi:hypothetical protein
VNASALLPTAARGRGCCRRFARIVAEAVDPEPSSAAGTTAGRDPARLRDLPAVSRATSGAVFGTDPVRALLAKERQRRR